MARYFIDVIHDGQRIVDWEGTEFGDLDAVGEEATQGASELLAFCIREGRNTADINVSVRNESGNIVLIVPLGSLTI